MEIERANGVCMDNNTIMDRIPIACDLTALDAKQRQRHMALLDGIRAVHPASLELPDGYAFLFPHDVELYLKIAEWATLESRCCPFFTFTLELGGDGGPLRLALTGREGVKQFVQSELGMT